MLLTRYAIYVIFVTDMSRRTPLVQSTGTSLAHVCTLKVSLPAGRGHISLSRPHVTHVILI